VGASEEALIKGDKQQFGKKAEGFWSNSERRAYLTRVR
jgi:hypothetical protein